MSFIDTIAGLTVGDALKLNELERKQNDIQKA